MVLTKFVGARHFRQRLVCATLSGRPIRIEEIHTDAAEPGLEAHEESFLRLLEKMSNGCAVEINKTGTSVYYRPGVLSGGRVVHDCSGCGRSVGYFVEGVVCLAPFGKEALTLTLTGVTNDNLDPSVDLCRAVLLPNLQRFGVEDGLDLRITRRGAPPLGGGECVFTCPVVRTLRPVQLLDEGVVRRVRGVAYAARMSPQAANRAIESARAVLNPYARDVFVYSDHRKGPDAGLAPGFAVALVAETTTGCLLSTELAGGAGEIPEELGQTVARSLLAEIERRGCVDTMGQWSFLLLMLLSTEDVSKVRLGRLAQLTVDCLRLYRDFFGVTFKVQPDPDSKTVVLSCLGIGYSNIAKRIF